MKNSWMNLRFFWKAAFLSPRDLVCRAFLLSALFLILHLAGLREFASVLNGTMGSIQFGWRFSAFLGAVYIFTYLGFIILVPIFVLGAVLLTIWNRFVAKQKKLDAADI